jgi:UDP-glucuronate 4-epimerase
MKLIVTGAAGFIGSHLSERLLAEGHEVWGVDNFEPFYDRTFKDENVEILSNSERFKFHELDIRSPGMKSLVKEVNPRVVVHLAAMAGVRPSIEDPEKYVSVNVDGTVNILEGMREVGVGKLVFASSSSVYGGNEKVPFSEADPVDHPVSPYASTKKCGELLCYTYHHLFGLDVTALRFFTVYGERQRPEMAIYKFTERILSGGEVPVYAMGESSRDYTYIGDIVEGIMLSLDHLGGYRVYNLGGSRVTKLSRLVEMIEDACGRKAKVTLLPDQPGDMNITYADVSKAGAEIGYNPVTPIEEGVEVFVKWYKHNRHKEV